LKQNNNFSILKTSDWCDDKFNNVGVLRNGKAQKLAESFDYKDFNKLANYWLKYEGDFKLDKKDGFGTLLLSNGEKFVGNFANDTVHGFGVFHTQDGREVQGYWEENEFVREAD
jgi:hypothetical protein